MLQPCPGELDAVKDAELDFVGGQVLAQVGVFSVSDDLTAEAGLLLHESGEGCITIGSIGLGTSRKSESTMPMRTESDRREVVSSAGREACKAPRAAAIAHIAAA